MPAASMGQVTSISSGSSAPPNDPSKPYPTVFNYIRVPGPWDTDNANFKVPELNEEDIVYVTKGRRLAWGGTAILEQLPSGAVIKTPIPNPLCPPLAEDCLRNMRVEAQVYRRIGEHARIPKLPHWDPDNCCLTMEYLQNGNLKEYIRRNKHSTIPPDLCLRWAQQAAEGLMVLHAAKVIHCDLCPRNCLLDSDLSLKICDFGGASLSGSEPSATPATRFLHPFYDYNILPVFRDDLFSLGSLIYFIMTGHYPYEEAPSDEVIKHYETQKFPDTRNVGFDKLIRLRRFSST
ncbi:predicted protein [Uncinocarpus reesii 1704]|uniref:EKC/KEOPS complex subunit BUD32 n=1 Tax=Uncinocarpus reesii (strain UAMH 1704) TaxID=336963 RepID=C4JL46_UNCRE|nr:uncharacterized protein UREG_00261 [Uncinocarpus reesii 1704]EEP75415.1 predicted protein [Uncinocarpus reesii 1704]